MTSIIFLENTQGFVVVAGHPLGSESTNSTFNLNFPPKFLEFRKWSLDSYKITKVQKIHQKNHRMKNKLSQVTKKASEVPADPGTDIVVSNTAVKGPALKGSQFQVGGLSEAKALPPFPLQFGQGFRFNRTSPSVEKNPAPNSISNLLWLCSAAAECFNI